jgi:hypothetical protein
MVESCHKTNLVRELLRLLSRDDEQIIGLRLPASAHLARRAVCTARSSCYAWRREIRITGIVWLQEVVDKIEAKHQMSARDIVERARAEAREQGVSTETVINLWLRNRAGETAPGG